MARSPLTSRKHQPHHHGPERWPVAALCVAAAALCWSGCFGAFPQPVEDQVELRSGEATAKAAQEAALEADANDETGLALLSNDPIEGGAPDRRRIGFEQTDEEDAAPQPPVDESAEPVVLRLDPSGGVTVVGRQGGMITGQALGQLLTRLRAEGRPIALEVPADKIAEQPFVDLLRAIRDAGFDDSLELTLLPKATEAGPPETPPGPPVTPGAGQP